MQGRKEKKAAVRPIKRRDWNMTIRIPPQTAAVMEGLERSGFEAYAVGGCVRDRLLGLEPKDWDVTTSALPEQAEHALANFQIAETGLKHGTITVVSGGMPVEVTTYRIDGPYSDNRHPDGVTFTRSLEDDLARRDFTVNAMACGLSGEIVDRFGGREDLGRKLIRCVGNPDARFHEDGLRILRALRFSSVLGFSIEEKTGLAVLKNCSLLGGISAERSAKELSALLCGKNAAAVLRDYRGVIGVLIPELRAEFDFPQDNPYHCFDVWEHTVNAVERIEPDPLLRLVMLLHDIGKPSCRTTDQNGVGHFYGHGKKSAELSKKVLKRLKYDGKTIRTAAALIRWHDLPLNGNEKLILRRLNLLGEKNLRLLIKIRAADIQAQAPEHLSRLNSLAEASGTLEKVLAQGPCFSRKDLAVNGSDLLKAGIPPGREIGQTLDSLLEAVLDGRCPNAKEDLLRLAEKMKGGSEA